MGYIENLRDKRINEFVEQLKELTEENMENAVYENSFLLGFDCGYHVGFSVLKSLNKSLKEVKRENKRKRQIIREWSKEFSKIVNNDTSIDNDKKRKINQEINSIAKKNIRQLNEKVDRLKKIKADLLLRLFNGCAYIFMILASFVIVTAVGSRYGWIKILGYVTMLVALIEFVVRQIRYTVKYLKAINATRQGTILYCIKRGFSTLLIVWWYLSALVFINNWNIKISTYSFVSICAIPFISELYDFFLSSSYFDEPENTIALVAATLIGIVMVMNLVKSESVKLITGWILFTACLLLSMLTIKKFLIDKSSVDSLPKVLFVVSLLIITVVGTILSLYLTLWKKTTEGQVVDNSLFSAAVGVYAALLGGGLTLAGVAWTIKSTSNERTEELKYRCCPYMSIVSACYQSNTLNKMADIEIEGSISGTIAKTHTKLFRVRLSKNADCIIKGVLVNGEFRRVKNESISVAESEFNIGVVNMKELITIETFSIVVTDILQNWYKYNCKVVPVDAEDCKEYMIQSIGLPTLMNTNEIKEIK